jgi:crotonobetaine/carnitine-CoA ligase
MNVLQFADETQRHVGRAIALQAQQCPDAPFILWGEASYSFAEVDRRVDELAGGLRARGLDRGSRVAFYMASAPEVILLALAANKLGAVWVPINAEYKGAWLSETVNRSRPDLLVTDDAHAPAVAAVAGDLEVDRLAVLGDATVLPGAEAFSALCLAGAPAPDMAGLSYGDTCAILWTSGTTGRSKGVMQSHNVWFRAVESANRLFGIVDDDVIYSVLPMYNSAAWVTGIFRALFAGLPLAIDSAFSVHHFWERVDYYRATQSFTLGAMHMFLWNAPPRADDGAHSLRKLMAVPMPPDVAGPFCERFAVELMPQGLGQSEAMTLITQLPGEHAPAPPGSCGVVAPGLAVRLVDDDGNDVATGEPGELWVKPLAPFLIFNGYFDDPEATAGAYQGEWYKTGDMLRQDAAGFYFFVDRKKDAVRYKGRNISTFEVEYVARRHPAIADCAAYGIPSEELAAESELKLDVILRQGAQLGAEELAGFINDNAPYFFVPRYIEFVGSLPYTPTNKVQKFKLRRKGVGEATWDARAAGYTVRR